MKNHYDNPYCSLKREGEKVFVSGVITQQTVMHALTHAKNLLAHHQKIEFNLSGVNGCDSASLVFLTDLLRQAKRQGQNLVFSHLPKGIQQLTRVCGIEGFLPLAED